MSLDWLSLKKPVLDWLAPLEPEVIELTEEELEAKDTSISIRISKADKRLIKQLARKRKVSVSKLIITQPLKEAKKLYEK